MNRAPEGLLKGLKIASPCAASWDAMAGDNRVRFCGQCRLNVYNLSAMTREEAEALVAGREGRLCARFFLRRDGTVLTRDCPVGWRQRARRRLKMALATAGALLLLAGSAVAFVFGRAPSGRRFIDLEPFGRLVKMIRPDPPVVMGEVECPPPPSP